MSETRRFVVRESPRFGGGWAAHDSLLDMFVPGWDYTRDEAAERADTYEARYARPETVPHGDGETVVERDPDMVLIRRPDIAPGWIAGCVLLAWIHTVDGQWQAYVRHVWGGEWRYASDDVRPLSDLADIDAGRIE